MALVMLFQGLLEYVQKFFDMIKGLIAKLTGKNDDSTNKPSTQEGEGEKGSLETEG